MSTRSVIARVGEHEGEFEGVYAHWDGMPITRGPLLWKIVHEEFKGNLKKALVYLIDKHPAGWSSLDNRNCYCHPSKSKDSNFKGRKPEPANKFTQANVLKGYTNIEWLYVFDEQRNRLFVRDVCHAVESLIELSGPEPDWMAIECGDNFERCSHYAWYHRLVPKTSNLGTRTWLGNQPLELHDAIAFIVRGKRYKSTGCGGDADFLSRGAVRFPSGTWVQTLVAANGRRLNIPVAQRTDQGYIPLPGVQWVFPPTKNNPEETIMEAKGKAVSRG